MQQRVNTHTGTHDRGAQSCKQPGACRRLPLTSISAARLPLCSLSKLSGAAGKRRRAAGPISVLCSPSQAGDPALFSTCNRRSPLTQIRDARQGHGGVIARGAGCRQPAQQEECHCCLHSACCPGAKLRDAPPACKPGALEYSGDTAVLLRLAGCMVFRHGTAVPRMPRSAGVQLLQLDCHKQNGKTGEAAGLATWVL